MRLYGGRLFALDDHLTRLGRSAANLRLPIDLDAVRADVEALVERNDVAATPRCASWSRAAGTAWRIVEELKPLPDDARAGHDRVRAHARARRGQVALLRREHARPPPGPGARRRRRAAGHAARPRARGPDDHVLLLARRRDARHAAAVRAHPRLDHAPPPLRDHRRDRAGPRPRRPRARARGVHGLDAARGPSRSTRSTAPRCRRRPAR